MRGWSAWNGAGLSREPLQSALQFFEQALRIDPEQTDALIGLGLTTASLVRYRLIEPDEQVLSRADNAVARALSREPAQAMAHFAKGELLRARKRFDEAIAEYDTATALNSNLAPAYAYRGQSKLLAGRAAETFLDVDAAIRLSPRDPSLNLWLFFKCHAFAHLANDDDAIEWCRKSVALRPFWISYIDLISAYGWTGRREEAHAAIIELHKLMPGYTVKKWANAGWSDNPIFLAEYARIVEGLRKGGLPEE